MDHANYWASATATADLGDTISQSLRFGSGRRLNKDDFSQNHGEDATISFWFKRGRLGTLQTLGCQDNGQHNLFARFNTSDQLVVLTHDGSGGFTTSQRFRDPSAWYHFVVTDEKCWINGEVIATGSWLDGQESHSKFNIGLYGANLSQHFDGYMAEFYFVDGTNMNATDFGRYNADGVWVPKTPTISSYGNNGFHLTFDNLQDNGIGHDSSGNGNHFTASGFDTSAISSSNKSNDLISDTPTNNWATGNSAHTANNLSFANLGFNNSGRAKTTGTILLPKTGVWQFEYLSTTGYQTHFGFQTSDTNLTTSAAYLSTQWKYVNDGRVSVAGTSNTSGVPSASNGDVFTMIYDRDNDEAKWYRNGTLFFTLDPLPTNDDDYVVLLENYQNSNEFNFGQYDFQHTPVAGAKSLNSNNLAEPTIKNGKDHFDILTYTGNGSNQTISGLNFQPDFLWIKNRSSGQHVLQDSVRGASKQLWSNLSDDEQTNATNFVTSFTSDGFTSGPSAQGTGDTNSNNSDFVAWCWKGGGTAVTNESGSIDSQVSANTDAGFSIVSYTGNDTAGATIGHGLNSAPEVILLKNRDESAGRSWAMYHVGVDASAPEDYRLGLNLGTGRIDSTSSWNDTAPTDTVFTVGDSSLTNATDAFIAYCWHSVDGFSKFGSYTGNGSTNGPFVYCGFKPAWLLVRQADVSSGNTVSWSIIDAERSTTNPAQKALQPNSSGSESDSSSFAFDFLSNGFKVRNSTDNNTSGKRIIYMAFGSNPFGGENAPPATAR